MSLFSPEELERQEVTQEAEAEEIASLVEEIEKNPQAHTEAGSDLGNAGYQQLDALLFRLYHADQLPTAKRLLELEDIQQAYKALLLIKLQDQAKASVDKLMKG